MNTTAFGEFLSAAEQPVVGGQWIKLMNPTTGMTYFYKPGDRTSRELAPGSQVTLAIEILRPSVRLLATGEVKWCRRDESDPKRRWTAGIAFVKLSEEDEDILRTVDEFYLS